MITPLGLTGGLHEITADVEVIEVALSFPGDVLGSVTNKHCYYCNKIFLLSSEVITSCNVAGPSPTVVAALTEQV